MSRSLQIGNKSTITELEKHLDKSEVRKKTDMGLKLSRKKRGSEPGRRCWRCWRTGRADLDLGPWTRRAPLLNQCD